MESSLSRKVVNFEYSYSYISYRFARLTGVEVILHMDFSGLY